MGALLEMVFNAVIGYKTIISYVIIGVLAIAGISGGVYHVENKYSHYEKTISDMNVTIQADVKKYDDLNTKYVQLTLIDQLDKVDNQKLTNALTASNQSIDNLNYKLQINKQSFDQWRKDNSPAKWGAALHEIVDVNMSNPTCKDYQDLSKKVSEIKYEDL